MGTFEGVDSGLRGVVGVVVMEGFSMKDVGLLFSGQGAQVVGMGKSLVEVSGIARELYAEADAVLGWSLSEVSFEGPEEALTETRVCQPALFVHGYAVFRILSEAGALGTVRAAAGLSLGELTALTAAGVFDFATGLRLVAERGRLMQEACDRTEGGMASFIGGTTEAVEAICEEFGIEIANLNCPGQIVVSGERDKVLAAAAVGRERGFKLAKALNVAGAYHSGLMESARMAFREVLVGARPAEPRFAVYANVTGERIDDIGAVTDRLERQVVGTVRFEACLRKMAADFGLSDFVECGPGKVIGGLAKRTDKSWTVRSVAEAADLETLA